MRDRNKPEDAEKEFRRAIEIHEQRAAKFPDQRINDLKWAAAYFDLARLLVKSGRAQEAVPLLARGVAVTPEKEGQADTLIPEMILANLFREAGEINKALARYTGVIATKPDTVEAWSGRGHCFLTKGEFAKAAEGFSQAIKLQPDHSESWTGRAAANFHLHQWDSAVTDYSEAIELAPVTSANTFASRGVADSSTTLEGPGIIVARVKHQVRD